MFKKNYSISTLEHFLEKVYKLIKPPKVPRNVWEKAFKKMYRNNDDKLLIPEIFLNEDF